jgi:hypothetical protein
MLEEAIEGREYLITTDKSLKAFVNQFIKVLDGALKTKQPEMIQKAELMRQILKIFKEKADVLCDEADLILDPRRELNFPAGKATPLPETYLALSLKIYQWLTSPEIQKIASFEFAPSAADTCTPGTYEGKVKPALVKQVITFLLSKEKKERFPELRQFYQNCTSDQKKQLESYFAGNDENHEAENWIDGLSNDELRNQLGLIRGQINILLPLTLQKNMGNGTDSIPTRASSPTHSAVVTPPISAPNSAIRSNGSTTRSRPT